MSNSGMFNSELSSISQNRQSLGNIEFLGKVQFPTGLTFADTEVGGLSGLTYDSVRGVYYALSDDRSEKARFYTARINWTDGALENGDITFEAVTTPLDKSGDPFSSGSLDPEGISLSDNGTLYVSSEGDANQLDVDKIFRPTEVVEFAPDQWGVDGSPVTTTLAGLGFVLNGEAPDLVISGINEGENIGPGGAVSSGTVSAAVTVLLRDVPAIAVRAGIDLSDPNRTTTDAAYEIGAAFVVDLIAKLQATQGNDAKILPEGEGLSINIPVRFPVGVEGIQGVAFTDASDISPFTIDFGVLLESFGGGAGLRFVPFNLPEGAEVSPTSEGGQFLFGFITVTPIDGDWTASEIGQPTVEPLLAKPTPALIGNSDDPAIWVNPENGDNSLVIGTLKDGGLAVFDLQGNIVQKVLPAPFGDAGDDQIWGDDGDDIIRGGKGNDILTGDNFSGGQGIDTFVLAIGEGSDTIVDFEVGIDLIGLAGGLVFGQISISQQHNQTAIIAADETLAVLQGVNASALGESSFVLV